MRKQVRLTLASLLFLTILLAACSSQLKTVSRSVNSTATRTPFLVKATYTSESPALEMAENEVVDLAAVTATPDPEAGKLPTEQAVVEEVSPTPTSTSTEDKSQGDPSSTPKDTELPATAKPTNPPATAKPTKPPAATNTPKPPANTNTPKPPAETNTPKPPPADTNTPKPPPPTFTATATQVCAPSGNSGYEQEVINLINQERAAAGLPALTTNSKLTSAARRHSADMACTDTWSHTGSDGSTPASRISDAGYSWSRVTENIAASSYQYFSPSSVVNLWMNSKTGHKENILDPNVIHIGVGFRFFDNGGYDAYYTADFARP